jgi:hypothetical protein
VKELAYLRDLGVDGRIILNGITRDVKYKSEMY